MKQFIRFGIVGVFNTLVSFVCYTGFCHLFSALEIFGHREYLAASVLAFVFSVPWSFYWNSRITFKFKSREGLAIWRAILRTYASYSVTGLFLNNVLLYVLVEFVNVPKSIVYLACVAVTFSVNFMLNKYWAFKSPLEKL